MNIQESLKKYLKKDKVKHGVKTSLYLHHKMFQTGIVFIIHRPHETCKGIHIWRRIRRRLPFTFYTRSPTRYIPRHSNREKKKLIRRHRQIIAKFKRIYSVILGKSIPKELLINVEHKLSPVKDNKE